MCDTLPKKSEQEVEMAKILLVLVWPVGIAVILCVPVLLARRDARLAAVTAGGGPARPFAPVGRHGSAKPLKYASDQSPVQRIARYFLVVFVGAAVIYAVMVLVGLIVVHGGPAIDKPIFHWTATHRIHLWKAAMVRTTKIGNSWTTWSAAATAAVCLAVACRKDRWIPPVVLGSLIVVDKFLTLAINHTIRRTPPPGAGGLFPSGGSDRAIVIYGVIAYLLWREFSGRRQTALWAAAAVAALGFNEGYSRGYLTVHWFTDILSGVFYGCMMLILFIAAARLLAGPAEMAAAARTRQIHASQARAPAREVPT